MNITGAAPPVGLGTLGMKEGIGAFLGPPSSSPGLLMVYALMKLGLTKRSRVFCCRGLVKAAPGKLSLGETAPSLDATPATASRESPAMGPPAKEGCPPLALVLVNAFPTPESVLELELVREWLPGPRSAKNVFILPLLAVRLGGALAPLSPARSGASMDDSPFTRHILRSSS